MTNNQLKIIITSFLLFGLLSGYSQYAPPAGQSGSTSISADSNIFIAWASGSIVERGFVDISNQSLGLASFGNDESGVNIPDNGVVSLGDGGSAILTFDIPLADGNGWDFAIFENSFSDDFLEFAFVEVSSNNIDYYRFNSISLTQVESQISTFGVTDATEVNNLAGKYQGFFGVPFDLWELRNKVGLDIYNITSIKIIDVIGSLNSDYSTFDSENRIINDPWPTPFESSGFDLDAVGVINNRDNTSIIEMDNSTLGLIYPNPVSNSFLIKSDDNTERATISTLSGTVIREISDVDNEINIQQLKPGYYIITIYSKNSISSDKLIKL